MKPASARALFAPVGNDWGKDERAARIFARKANVMTPS